MVEKKTFKDRTGAQLEVVFSSICGTIEFRYDTSYFIFDTETTAELGKYLQKCDLHYKLRDAEMFPGGVRNGA